MPVLFVGHGSPMNAIQENEFTKGFREIAGQIPRPESVLVVSAHWETHGTYITAMNKPRTIHDFGGFPGELYKVEYACPGNPELAGNISTELTEQKISHDFKWGLDHGAWSVVKHLYPDADIPVLELSLNYCKKHAEHFELARELAYLRKQGVLIIGSGNMVHNLSLVDWSKLDKSGYAYDWAAEANEKMKQWIVEEDYESLINIEKKGTAFRLSMPTPDHYLPLLYTMGLRQKDEPARLFNDQPVAGSISMTSVIIG